MPEYNFLAIAAAALVPMILGALYYGPLFGKQWAASTGKTLKELEPDNMAITYGLALLVAFILAFSLKTNIELTHKDVNDAGELIFGSFHTFKHGAIHGLMTGVLVVTPVIVSLSLFHKMSAKNIILNVVFWLLAMAIMGGIVDAWL